MMRPIFPEQVQLLIAGYILGNLDAEEAAEFEHLLANHPMIAVELAEMQQALELAYNPVEVAPPAHLRAVILGDIAQDHASATVAAPRASAQSFRWDRAMGMAAAAAILLLGINNYRLWSSLQTAQQAPLPAAQKEQPKEQEILTYRLTGTELAELAATVVVNPTSLEADFMAQNLPPLPAGKTYVLWTVLKPEAPVTKDQKSAILTTVFKVDEQGNSSQRITVPEVYRSKNTVVKVAVTVEDAAAPQEHVGDPVLITKS